MGQGLGLPCCRGCDDQLCHRVIMSAQHLPSHHVLWFHPRPVAGSSCDLDFEDDYILYYVSDYVYEGTAGGISVQVTLSDTMYALTGSLPSSVKLRKGFSTDATSGYRPIESLVITDGIDTLAYIRDGVDDVGRLVPDLDLSTLSCCLDMYILASMVSPRVVNYPLDATLHSMRIAMSGFGGSAACTAFNTSRDSTTRSVTQVTLSGDYGSAGWPITHQWSVLTSPDSIEGFGYRNSYGYFSDNTLAWTTTTLAYSAPASDVEKFQRRLSTIRRGTTGDAVLFVHDITIAHDPSVAMSATDMYGPTDLGGVVGGPCTTDGTLDEFSEL